MREKKAVSPEVFNYGLFHADVLAKCKELGLTLQELSEKKFYRHKSYLRSRFCERSLPLNIILGLCDCLDLNAKTYEKRKEQATVVEQANTNIVTISDSKPILLGISCGGKQYICETKIYADAQTVISTLVDNGEAVGYGRARFHPENPSGILSSVSYALYTLGLDVKDKIF